MNTLAGRKSGCVAARTHSPLPSGSQHAVNLPTVRIVIVNWNAGEQLRDCLESIAAGQPGDWTLEQIVVVDNASGDGSADDLEDDFNDLPLIVVRNTRNRGFGAACNQGAKGTKADFVLFLNPDARLGPNTLARALAPFALPEHARTGIVGVQLRGADGDVHRSCARFPTPARFWAQQWGLHALFAGGRHHLSGWDHRTSRFVDHVMGAFFLVRQPVFDTMNGFDEAFFVYLEDLDFSRRARAAGWRTFFHADAHAFHKGGGTSEQARAARLFYSRHSRLVYARKHFGTAAALALMPGALVIEPIIRLARALLLRRSPTEAGETLAGFTRLWRAVLARRGAA